MAVIMIESPYSGDIDRNIRYLALCGFDSAVLHDECPYASHGLMTQHPRCKDIFVSDYNEKWDSLTREQAIERSQRMRKRCDKTVFYTDLGWSSGMKAAKDYCQDHKLQWEERQINFKNLSQKIQFCTEEFCTSLLDSTSNNYKIMLE